MARPLLCIVTPALADANNGNWQTASRWARMLARDYRVRLVERWQAADGPAADMLIALHALRSATSIAQWARHRPGRPLVVVLTGTDLYRDILEQRSAQHSLELAHRLVVLHERAVDDLPPQHRAKAVACFQSAPERATLAKTPQYLRALMVGHLREEKSPQTYFDAARLLATRHDVRLDHIGSALNPAYGTEALALQAACPGYRWFGALPHASTRRRIQRAHVLVHCSRIEGGAHVVMEAVRSGTPVLASRISGNVGMLGADYRGYFEAGDAPGLAALLQRCRDEPPLLQALQAQCDTRAPLFDPAHEREGLRGMLAALMSAMH